VTDSIEEAEDPGIALKSFLARRGRREPPAPSAMATGTSLASRASSDWKLAALGLTLALTCALFPWYIFFNQEQFGIRALEFAGQGNTSASASLTAQPQRIGAPFDAYEVPISQLDLFATGTVSPDAGTAVPLSDQPFPADEAAEYRLVHVANGRAMIEDADGIWIVQLGSILPDNSRLTGIERRGDSWALVTSEKKVVELSR